MPHSLPAFRPEGYDQTKSDEPAEFRVKGSLRYLDPSTSFDPSQIPDKFLSCAAVFSISGYAMSDRRFWLLPHEPSTLNSLRLSLAERSPSLSVLHTENCDPAFEGRDSTDWKPSLDKGFFSVSRHGRQWDFKDYKLMLYVPNETLAKELRNVGIEASHRSLDMSVGEFMKLPQFINARSLAVRNICRAAEAVAAALDVKIDNYQPDDRVQKRGRVQPATQMARPDALSIFGNMVRAQVHETADSPLVDSVVISERLCTPLDTTGCPILPLGALGGVALLNADNSRFHRQGISKADLQQFSIPAGPVDIHRAEHVTSDRDYVENVCFWDREKSEETPASLMTDPQSATLLQKHVENAYKTSSTLLGHIISYQAI